MLNYTIVLLTCFLIKDDFIVHWFSIAAVTSYPKLGDLKQHPFIFLQF